MNQVRVQKDLDFIKKIIEDTKRKDIYSGKLFIFWGFLVIMAIAAQYLLEYFKLSRYIVWNWIFFMGLGYIYSFFSARRETKGRQIVTSSARVLRATWLGCGISGGLMVFIAPLAGVYEGVYVFTLVAMLLALGFFITGGIYDWNLFRWAGAMWWLGAVVTLFIPKFLISAVFALLLFVAQVIPGLVMYSRFKVYMGEEDGQN